MREPGIAPGQVLTIRSWIPFLLVIAASALRPTVGAEPASAGPLRQEFPLTFETGERTEAIGPFWATERRWPEDWESSEAEPTPAVTEIARTFTLAPLFNWNAEPTVDNVSWDFVYPVVTYDRYGGEYRFQFFQMLSFSGGRTQEQAQGRGFSLIPFFWYRHSAEDPSLNYAAVWPFYGTMQKRLFRDETKFVLWPAYVQTRRRDVVTDNYLVPFVHTRQGDGLKGWQVWPFYGTEHKDITTRTNGFGDTEVVPGYDQRFVLWPFYSAADLAIGSTNPVTQRVLLPFYSLQYSPAKDRQMYGWPFGVSLVQDRETGYRQTSVLFPFLTFAHGPGKQATRLWPLYGTTRFQESQSVFAAWPLYYHKDILRDPLERHTTRVAFFVYTDIETRNRKTGKTGHRTDLWPLFIARRDLEGNERFQMLALLEPIIPENKSVQRLYSPLWALWRAENNPGTGVRTQSLLWNLYRHESRPQSKKCSLLFGLIQYHSTPEGKRWRFLYLPTGGRATVDPAPPQR
jgi:hypothetical protein